MKYQKLDKNIIKSWRISAFILLIILTIIYLIGRYIQHTNFYLKNMYIIDIVGLVFLAILILNIIVNPIIRYKRWAYLINDEQIEIIKGILTITNTIVPIERIQHVDITQGPINRIYNLASVTVTTAAGTLSIEGITYNEATDLAEKLKNIIKVKIND